MTAPVLFADVPVGVDLPAVEVDVTTAMVTDYLEATGGPAAVPRPDGQVVAPPTLAAVLLKPVLSSLRSPPGGIHAKQLFRFHAPIVAGSTVTTTARVRDKKVRRGRNYVVMETGIHDAAGQLLVSGVMTRIWAA